MTPSSRAIEVCSVFLKLGLTSFGGPVAHLGYLRREVVERRGWLGDEAYADLVALCQLLPGPTSSQVVFGLGLRRAGVPGALLASACFMLPSAVAMVAFAYGLGHAGDLRASGWLHGLRLAAVAAVALAVSGMARSLCPDWPRRLLGAAAAGLVLLLPGTPSQVGAIAACALAGRWALASRVQGPVAGPSPGGRAPAAACLLLFACLLLLLPVAARLSGSRVVEVFDSFYRSGALVFGGGHVVLPLLRSEVVPRGWTSDSVFLAGYGAAQALPGPLFTFAAFLGTVILPGPLAWAGGALALVAIFLPGWLLVLGIYPFWHGLRDRPWFQGAIQGANAAVVGILFAALCRPVASESIRGWGDGAAAVAALVLMSAARAPAWLVVGLMAAAGQWILR
jgi:chromate transporter